MLSIGWTEFALIAVLGVGLLGAPLALLFRLKSKNRLPSLTALWLACYQRTP